MATFSKRQFRIFEDRPDFDREALATVAALVSPIVREVVDFDPAAVRAERAVRPTDRAEMPDAGLLVRESCDQFQSNA